MFSHQFRSVVTQLSGFQHHSAYPREQLVAQQRSPQTVFINYRL